MIRGPECLKAGIGVAEPFGSPNGKLPSQVGRGCPARRKQYRVGFAPQGERVLEGSIWASGPKRSIQWGSSFSLKPAGSPPFLGEVGIFVSHENLGTGRCAQWFLKRSIERSFVVSIGM